MQRHVVVAGHHDLRLRQAIEKVPCVFELRGPRALGQITGDHKEIRREFPCERTQGIEQARVDTAEVQIGEVQQRAHQPSSAVAASGTITRSAPARLR